MEDVSQMANLAVFGMGYVGSITAACFASKGHHVIGVDVNPDKIELLRRGEPTVAEPGLRDLVSSSVRKGKLCVTHLVDDAVSRCDISFVTVGTPSRRNGDVELDALRSVLREIGQSLKKHRRFHTIVVRSTILPGTTASVVLPTLAESSGLEPQRDFDVYFNPEFLREGSSVRDFHEPPYVIIGGSALGQRNALRDLWSSLSLNSPIFELKYEEAEMLKYASNAFHAAKVVFANEVGAICKDLSVDGQRVMEIFVKDTQLNASARYLMPGFSYGGSCLPKDVSALTYLAKSLDVSTPLLNSLTVSNDVHLMRGARMVLETGKRKVCLVGLGFKEGTDDVRNSPAVLLAEHLLGKGLDVTIFDRIVQPEYLMGRNKQFLDMTLPHLLSHLRPNLADAIDEAEVVVVCAGDPEIEKLLLGRHGKKVIDLVGLRQVKQSRNGYAGIAW
jgi:nucleotide sugar dehydrogenase